MSPAIPALTDEKTKHEQKGRGSFSATPIEVNEVLLSVGRKSKKHGNIDIDKDIDCDNRTSTLSRHTDPSAIFDSHPQELMLGPGLPNSQALSKPISSSNQPPNEKAYASISRKAIWRTTDELSTSEDIEKLYVEATKMISQRPSYTKYRIRIAGSDS
ncbi:unnamed protein product [Protopolystoma xenopodis]|uniref:Uncharacterized protein n=1 Tax=Protopolystoma xenopodis TaxID=117903 RepID=A0A448WIP6_9PLAT|nr:unnamed protein product [Protopolystoma xenopodis]